MNVPYAKVYLRDSTNAKQSMEGSSQLRVQAKRYRICASVLALEENDVRKGSVLCNLYVVKGNPLIISNTPLACFASGTDSVVVDVKDDFSDLTDVCLQMILTDMGSHLAVPVDELLDACSKGDGERSLTTWDTQSGGMRGTALVRFRVECEQPHSYEEVIDKRKREGNTRKDTVPLQPETNFRESSSLSLPPRVSSYSPPVEENTFMTRMSNYTNELIGTARTEDELLAENEVRKADLIEQANRMASVSPEAPRRKRGVLNHISFAVNDTNDLQVDE